MADKDKFADEMLTDDELDGVAGGTAAETAEDSQFLHDLNGSTMSYSELSIRKHDLYEEITKAWATVGVKAVINTGNMLGDGKPNEYYINGHKVWRKQAMEYAKTVVNDCPVLMKK